MCVLIYTLPRAGVTEGTEIKGITDADVISVSKKITTLEMKELNERQRADHAVNMYEQQKAILHNLETRNKDLEDKFAEVRNKHRYWCCTVLLHMLWTVPQLSIMIINLGL